MRKLIEKMLLGILVIVLTLTMLPSASFATGHEGDNETVSDNSPDVTDNDPDRDSASGFTIRFGKGKPEKSPKEVEGTMEEFFVPFSSVSENNKVALPKNNYTLQYYSFRGWHCEFVDEGGNTIRYDFDDEAEIGDIVNGAENMTLNFIAKWEAKNYSIKYSLAGGTNNSKNVASLTAEDSALTLQNPTKEGYKFLGWYSDSEYTNRVKIVTAEMLDAFYEAANPGDAFRLYAKWTQIKYSIKFDANGGSGKMSTLKNVTYGEKTTLPKATFTRKGMTFTGWNTKANGKGTKYADKATVSKLSKKDGDVVTLYAQWKYTKYSIKYKNMTGATNSKKNPSSYTMASKKITFYDPAKTGYTFHGWYKDSKFKTKIKSIAAGSTGNVTIYAKWTENKYSVKYNANGGSGTMSKKTNIKYSTKFNLAENKYTKTGYVFAGWNTKANGSGKSYSNKQKVSGLSSKNGATVTLYAQWKPIKYNIKFDGNGATSGKTTNLKNLVYGKTYKLSSNKFKRSGYKFVGWNVQKNGSGKAYTNGQSIKNLSVKNGETIVLYARWIKSNSKTYTERELFTYFVNDEMTIWGAAGLLGNLKAESDLRSNNLQNTFNEKLGMTDEEYTKAVDNGTYTNFANDQAGYGLAQWTSAGRKQALLNYARSKEVSISDTQMQLEFLIYELAYNYNDVYKTLQSTKSVTAASTTVMLNYEKPQDQSKEAQAKRTAIATEYFKKFCPDDKPEPGTGMGEEDCPFTVQITISNLNIRSGPGTNYERVGVLTPGKYKIIHVKAGTGSTKGWGQLDGGKGWIALDYATRVE